MTSKRRRVFYGWWVTLTAALGPFWGAPVTVFPFSVFLKPLMRDYPVGRAAVSLGYTLGSFAAVISALLTGRLDAGNWVGSDHHILCRAATHYRAWLACSLCDSRLLAMGVGFDWRGSYGGPLAAFFVSSLFATALITRLGEYRYHAGRPDESDSALLTLVEG